MIINYRVEEITIKDLL